MACQSGVTTYHAKMVISTLATQLGQYTVSFWDFTYCMMINTSWGNVAECLWWNFCCTYWSVKTLYLTNGKYLFIIIKNYIPISLLQGWMTLKIASTQSRHCNFQVKPHRIYKLTKITLKIMINKQAAQQ